MGIDVLTIQDSHLMLATLYVCVMIGYKNGIIYGNKLYVLDARLQISKFTLNLAITSVCMLIV